MSSIKEYIEQICCKGDLIYYGKINGYKQYKETNKFKPNRQEYFLKIPY